MDFHRMLCNCGSAIFAHGGEASDSRHSFSPDRRDLIVSKRKPVIAAVDDDPRVLESLENLFESAGYVVRTFSSAKALIDAGSSDIDCLITDIGMPSMNGFELHEFVRKARPDLPVFLRSEE